MKNKLKKTMAASLASLEILLGASAVKAMDGPIKFGKKEPTEQVEINRPISLKDNLLGLLKFGAGAAIQGYVHKFSHYPGAELSGTKINYTDQYGNWEYENRERSDSQIIATRASGFIGPWLLSEAVLRSDKISKDGPFARGIILEPLAHNAVYIFADAMGLLDKNYNDIEEMSQAGLKREITYPLLLAIPAIQAWRALKNKKNDENKKSLTSKTKFWSAPTSGGAMLGFTRKF